MRLQKDFYTIGGHCDEGRTNSGQGSRGEDLWVGEPNVVIRLEQSFTRRIDGKVHGIDGCYSHKWSGYSSVESAKTLITKCPGGTIYDSLVSRRLSRWRCGHGLETDLKWNLKHYIVSICKHSFEAHLYCVQWMANEHIAHASHAARNK